MPPQPHAAHPPSDRHGPATLGWVSWPVTATAETVQQIVTALLPDGWTERSGSAGHRFKRLDLVGQVTERIWDDSIGLQPTGLLPFAPARQPGRRLREMPLDRNVISFPAAR